MEDKKQTIMLPVQADPEIVAKAKEHPPMTELYNEEQKQIGHDCKKGKHKKCNWKECECECHKKK